MLDWGTIEPKDIQLEELRWQLLLLLEAMIIEQLPDFIPYIT